MLDCFEESRNKEKNRFRIFASTNNKYKYVKIVLVIMFAVVFNNLTFVADQNFENQIATSPDQICVNNVRWFNVDENRQIASNFFKNKKNGETLFFRIF